MPVDIDGYRAEIRKAMKPLEDHVLNGMCGSLEDYKRKTGELAGLRKALEQFNTVLKRSDDDDEDGTS